MCIRDRDRRDDPAQGIGAESTRPCEGPLEMEITAGVVGEPKAGSVLRVATAFTSFGSGGDAPGDVDDDVTLTLLSQRPMMFQDSEVKMQDRMGALWTAVDDDVEHGLRMRQDAARYRFSHAPFSYSVGRCWATHPRAWNLWPCRCSQVEGPCGLSRVFLLSCTSPAMTTSVETCCRVG